SARFRQGEDGCRGGELLVLRPRRTERLSERGDPLLDRRWRLTDRGSYPRPDLLLGCCGDGPAPRGGGRPDRVAVELSLGCMNRSVGGEDRFEAGEGAPGGKQDSARLHVPLSPDALGEGGKSLGREAGRELGRIGHDLPRSIERTAFRFVVG